MAQVVGKISYKYDGSGLDKAKQGLTSFGEGVTKLEGLITKALPVLSLSVVLKKVYEFGSACVKEFGDAERSLLGLEAACKSGGQSFSKLKDLMDDASKKTLASKDEVEKLVTEIASLGKSTSDVEKLTKASVALSNVTGKDLNSAFQLLNGTYEGQAGKLSKLIPEIGDLTKAQLQSGEAVDLVISKLTSMSDAMSTGYAQSVKNLKTSWGDLMEGFGANLEPVFSPWIAQIDNLISKWGEALKASATYKKAQSDWSMPAQASARKDQEQLLYGDGGKNPGGIELELKKARNDLLKAEASGTASFNDYGRVKALENRRQEIINAIDEIDERIRAIQSVTPIGDYFAPSSLIEAGKTFGQAVSGIMLDSLPYGGANDITKTNAGNGYYGWVPTDAPLANSMEGVGGANDLDKLKGGYDGPTYATEGGGETKKSDGWFLTVSKLFNSSIVGMIASISSIQKLMNPVMTVVQAIFNVLSPVIDNLLTPIIGCLTILGNSIGMVLTPLLQALEPVIELITNAFILLYNYAIRPLFNAIIWIIATVYNLIASVVNAVIRALNKIPFVNVKWRMDKMDYENMTLDAVSMDDVTKAGQDTVDSNSSSSSSSASYTAVRDINIYITVEGNIVPYSNFVTELRGAITDAERFNR